jgi:hypothetical protein
MEYKKIIPDAKFKKYSGKFFNESWFTTIIDSDSDGYYLDDSGNKKVLFKFRKNKIPKPIADLAIDTFLEYSKKKHSGRGVAGGIRPGEKNARTYTRTGQNEGQYVASNVSGYYDRPLREHRGALGTIVAGRTTAFTLRNKKKWYSGLPFIEKCSKEYSLLGGKYYSNQYREYSKIKKQLKIPNTVFTTVTSNYNWRTACHCDAGDFSGGLGNLIVIGHNFKGCYLGFPQFKVLIKTKPGDFLLMDNHQYHCNTRLRVKKEGFRLSFVMYIRNDMSKCNTPKKIKDTEYYVI